MTDIILPFKHQIDQARALGDAKDPQCPAAKLGRYSDSGRQFLFCGVERKHFAVDTSPVSVHAWCCDQYTDCPVWQAMKESDPALERAKEADERQKVEALTKRQIEAGIRVDDQEQREFRQDIGDVE